MPLGGSWDALWVLLGLLASSWGSWGGFVEVPGVSGGDFDAYALECHDCFILTIFPTPMFGHWNAQLYFIFRSSEPYA